MHPLYISIIAPGKIYCIYLYIHLSLPPEHESLQHKAQVVYYCVCLAYGRHLQKCYFTK